MYSKYSPHIAKVIVSSLSFERPTETNASKCNKWKTLQGQGSILSYLEALVLVDDISGSHPVHLVQALADVLGGVGRRHFQVAGGQGHVGGSTEGGQVGTPQQHLGCF